VNSYCFNQTWQNCTSLTAQSVENILTSLDTSGVYGTDTGASGGTQLSDNTIDIDYDTATGSLSTATNSAIASLIGKDWEVSINGVLVVPNLLDLAPAAAYSLRSFDADADPNVVNVRRSSDNATSDFTASEVSDGTVTSWVGAGNDGHVTTWYDQGGTNHTTQATASNQPKIVDGGTLVTEGGQAALDFDGTNDYLQLTSNVFADRLEVGIVNHLEEDASKYQRLFNLSNGTDDDFMAVKANNEQLLLRTRTSQAGNTSKQFGSVINNHNLLYVTSTLSTDSYTASVDGASLTATTGLTLGSGSLSISTIGARSDLYSMSFCDGTIQEIVIYDSDQSANSTVIENNINDHFDIY